MNIKQGIQIQAKNSDTVEVILYGFIGRWRDIDARSFVNRLKDLEKKYKNAEFRVNSDGGDVIEGIAVFNALASTKLNVTFIIDGVAASMMAILVQAPNAKRLMHKHAKLMFHRVSGGANGNADSMRSIAELMESFEADFVDILVSKGLDEKTIKKELLNNKDNWIDAKKALKMKLIDGIIEDRRITQVATNLTNANEAFEFYDTQIINFNNQNTSNMELKAIIVAALASYKALNADATDTEISAVVNAVITENNQLKQDKTKLENTITELKAKVCDHSKDKVKNLIDAAIKDKKFTEDQRTNFTVLAESNFDNTKAILDKMPTHNSINSKLNGEGISDKRKDWDWSKWAKEDNAGLVAMRDSVALRSEYENLYEAKFGKKPEKQR